MISLNVGSLRICGRHTLHIRHKLQLHLSHASKSEDPWEAWLNIVI